MTIELWERQEGETAQAYKAFSFYRDMPPEQRSQHGAWRLYETHHLKHETPAKVPNGTFKKWPSLWNWTERSDAYDRWRERRLLDVSENVAQAYQQQVQQRCVTLLQKWDTLSMRFDPTSDSEHKFKTLIEAFRAVDDINRRAMGLAHSISSSNVTADIIPHEIVLDMGTEQLPEETDTDTSADREHDTDEPFVIDWDSIEDPPPVTAEQLANVKPQVLSRMIMTSKGTYIEKG